MNPPAGGFPADHWRSPPSPSLSNLSPLAAPFTAGRPLASDPPNPHGPTAPAIYSGHHASSSLHSDGFRFSNSSATLFYPSYSSWKSGLTGWGPPGSEGERTGVVGGDGSRSWMDPSFSYPVSPIDKGAASAENFPPYEDPLIIQTGPHFVPESSPWKNTKYPTTFSANPEPFSAGFKSSVVGPIGLSSLHNESHDSFSLNPSSTKFYAGSAYDKYITQLESVSTEPLAYKPNITRLGSTDSFSQANPCRISFDYFDYLPTEQKEPGSGAIHANARANRTAPYTIGESNKVSDMNLKKFGPRNIRIDRPKVTVADLNKTPSDPLDQHSVVLDSPCWKGYPLSAGQNENSSNIADENENASDPSITPSITRMREREVSSLVGSPDKKLKSVCVESATGLNNVVDSDPEICNNMTDLNKKENVTEETEKTVKEKKEEILGKSNPLDLQLIVKSMLNLSQVLLDSCGDNYELCELESKLLDSAIENLNSFKAKNKKTDEGARESSTQSSEKMKAGTDYLSVDSDIKKSMLQAIDKILSGNSDSDVRTILYKNLWIEAEAALCAMKYELQFSKAQVTLYNSHTPSQEANSSSSSDGEKPSNPIGSKIQSSTEEFHIHSEPKLTDTSKPDSEKAESRQNQADKTEQNRQQEVDPTVMARFNILKSRNDNSKPSDGSNPANLNLNFPFSSPFNTPNEENDGVVMARLRVLRARDESSCTGEDGFFPNYLSLEQMGLSDVAGPHNFHGGPGGFSLEWEHVLKDEILPPSNTT